MSCDPPWVLYSAGYIAVTVSFQNNPINIFHTCNFDEALPKRRTCDAPILRVVYLRIVNYTHTSLGHFIYFKMQTLNTCQS